MIKPINLIPMEFIQSRRYRLRVRRWSILGGAYGLVLLAITIVLQATWSFDDQAVAEQLNRATQGMQAAEKTMADLRIQLAEAVKQLEAGRAVSVQPDWSVLLALLSDARQSSVALQSISVQPLEIKDHSASAAAPSKQTGSPQAKTAAAAIQRPNYLLTISGLSQGQNEVSKFALRLERTGLFTQVALKESVRQTIGSTRVAGFKINCELSEEPPRSR